jgi:hypothetical protein
MQKMDFSMRIEYHRAYGDKAKGMLLILFINQGILLYLDEIKPHSMNRITRAMSISP